MSDVVFVILGGGALAGVQLLVLGMVYGGWNREGQRQRLQLMDAWRQSMEAWRVARDQEVARWDHAHQENMAFHRDHSVALRAILERVDRDR